MKNVTVTMDEDTARWVRIEAAQRGTSVSRLIGELLQQQRLRNSEYRAARESYRGRKAVPLKPTDENYPDRESLHDR
jgi:hypothetical protein